jgi:spore maturation protein CgeB
VIRSILIVGGVAETNVGLSLHEAAASLGIASNLMDSSQAFAGPKLLRALNWRLLGRRPVRIKKFSQLVVDACQRLRPDVLIATGVAPLSSKALRELAGLGVKRINFQTDDPWNPAHRAHWYLDALAEYDHIFTPRTATLPQLQAVATGRVAYVPFGYDPRLFYPEIDANALANVAACDVLLVGGADTDRIEIVEKLSATGLRVALYGGYWDRYEFARPFYRGMASPAVLRAAHARAKVAIGMVRRANRDGNSMRTFELAAMGACCLMEATQDHLDLFGSEGESVLYFSSTESLVKKCKLLCADDELRARLRCSVRARIEVGHTYRDRLLSFIGAIVADSAKVQSVA